MEGYQIIVLIAGIVLAVFGGLAFVIPALVKRGIDLSGVLSKTATALDTAGVVVGGLEDIFEGAPGFELAEKIIAFAKEGVAAAEQLYKTSKIEGGERKAQAAQIVYDLLQLAEIEVTPNMKKVVDGCIEAAVLVLPKTHGSE